MVLHDKIAHYTCVNIACTWFRIDVKLISIVVRQYPKPASKALQVPEKRGSSGLNHFPIGDIVFGVSSTHRGNIISRMGHGVSPMVFSKTTN